MTRLNPELRRQILEDMLGKRHKDWIEQLAFGNEGIGGHIESYEAYVNFKKEPMLPKKRQHRKRIPLWRFLLHLLHRDRLSALIQWTATDKFEFKIKEPNEVALLWGSIKDKSDMTYEKLGRAMRYYYGKNIIEKVPGKRYSYRFIPSRKTTKYIETMRKSSIDSSEDTEGSDSADSIKQEDFEISTDFFDDPGLTDSPSSYLNEDYDSPKSSTSWDADVCVKQEDLSVIYSNTIFNGVDSFQAHIEMLEYQDNDNVFLQRSAEESIWTGKREPVSDVSELKLTGQAEDDFLLDLALFDDFQSGWVSPFIDQ